MTTNPLRFCLTGETEEVVDRLLGEFLFTCMGKNDMAIANGMTSAAAVLVATHCQQTGEDFDELSNMFRNHFSNALFIAGENIKRSKSK